MDDPLTPAGGASVDPSDLAFASTQELIDELIRRKTFLGVVIYSDQEWRGGEWGAERTFKVRFNSNLDTTRTSRLLDRIAGHLDCYER
jgi:hypothetical protein